MLTGPFSNKRSLNTARAKFNMVQFAEEPGEAELSLERGRLDSRRDVAGRFQ